jgi:DNA-directed RNA polymerase I and III subunit RPAC1
MELICEKGVGKTHAKWSPVSTASYRLLPHIEFTEPIVGEEAEELKAKCPMGVFDIEDGELMVKNARNCTTCRECIRDPKFESRVKLQKVKNVFEFTVESVGQIAPENIVSEAIKVLKEKAEYWKEVVGELDQE